MRNYAKATVSQKAEKLIRGGHVWVYDGEIQNIDRDADDGELVDVISEKGKYLGTGFINSHSKIRIRIISKNSNDRFDDSFWERRVGYALDYRKTVMGDDFVCCRLIFGEADGFPGLTVDRFDNILSVQITCLGIDRLKDVIYASLIKRLGELGVKIDAIYERNDGKIRELEGLELYCGFYNGFGLRTDLDGKTVICENGIKYNVDYIDGQKTGFFLDQKYNRAAVAKIASGKRVLDCFTHTGAFALNAAMAGASHVTAVDISKEAVETAKSNAKLNCLDGKMDFVKSDVFDYLTALYEGKRHDFDLIILDPPAFTKSRDTVKDAIKGYKEINLLAMKILGRGGYLATCSCSHFMTDTYFKQMLHNAAEEAGVSLLQIEGRTQAPDHPILWNVPETFYLKFYIFRIV